MVFVCFVVNGFGLASDECGMLTVPLKIQHRKEPIMTQRHRAIVCALALAAGLSGQARAQVSQSRYLYTAPDPAATGGIKGEIVRPSQPVVGVFALPQGHPEWVYKAELAGPSSNRFAFAGLTVDRYDLLVVYDQGFYEGLVLAREENTLTKEDEKKIKAIIDKSEPFFNEKVIHRLAGKSGQMEGAARCICTFLRSKKSMGFIDGAWYPDHRRAFKLVVLEDVGPAWQIVRTREIFATQVTPGSGRDMVPHHYCPKLGAIRVTDSMKDLGSLDLTSTDEGR